MAQSLKRQWRARKFAQLVGLMSLPSVESSRHKNLVIVLLHGIGSDEQNLALLGAIIAPHSAVVSLRAPKILGPSSFAWFHAQFGGPQGPVHDWPEARASLASLEDALVEIEKEFQVTKDRIFLFGFSQGAIMTMGLALLGKSAYGGYVISSGRTLPEFAEAAKARLPVDFAQRRIFLAHGTKDSKLPVAFGQSSAEILRSLDANFTYTEYEAEHLVPQKLRADVQRWIEKL